MIINRCAILYNLCCDAMDLVNLCFGVQILLFICMSYVYSIFAEFALFRLWYSAPYDDNNTIIVVKQLMWTLYYFIFVLAIIALASSITNTVE